MTLASLTEPEPEELPVRAAGTLCWRPDSAGSAPEVLLVHSARWGQWSLPKGKLDPGELSPQAALRETREESGAQVVLGPRLPDVHYVLPDGRAKEVEYWSARVLRAGPRTASEQEIDDVGWVSLERARQLLPQPGMQPLLDAFEASVVDLPLAATSPVVVVRHGKARPRDSWSRADADRPLVAAGRRQAASLAGLLPCWAPQHVLSSPWRRCVDTLGPWASNSGVKVRTKGGLAEDGFRRHPEKVGKHVRKLLERVDGAVLCTHRPVLAGVVAALRPFCTPRVAAQLPDADPWLAPGEAMVLHVARPGLPGPPVVLALERFPAPDL